jgi:hypothetical protein
MRNHFGAENNAWRKPELIILSRSHPEEAILTVCKSGINPGLGGGINDTNVMCLFGDPCANCDTPVLS